MLLRIPTNAETLVLNTGDIPSFPPGFSRRFPLLTLLDIQSTRVGTILNDTFSGITGLDQVALTDCQVGTIERGAFEDISAVSQILFSGSEIGTIRSGAFARLSNIGEFSVWSNQIERVESGAFSGFSDLDSFAFYLNNVTTLSRNAFTDVENMGKVDVYMNKFFNAQGSTVMPLQAATRDMNMYANTFPCHCGVVRDFNTPLLVKYLVSQKCTEDGQVFRLSDMDMEEICSGQPSPTPSSTSTTTPGTTTHTLTDLPSLPTTIPIKVTKTVYLSTTPREGRESTTPTSSPAPASRSSIPTSFPSSDPSSTTADPTSRVTDSGNGQSSGQSGDSSSGARRLGTQVALVLWVTNLVAVAVIASACFRVQ
ncbi:hypothetical protein ACOMHN_045253 [Nucella lapillus]